MLSRTLIFILLSSLSRLLWADGLYLQTLKNTQPTEEQIQKSRKKIEEHKKVALRGELEVPPFHKRGKVDDSLTHSFCTTCHLTPPHTKSLRTRTFMNMHTRYIACETCHFRPKGVPLSYQWQDTRDASLVMAQPELFRQGLKPVKKLKVSKDITFKKDPLVKKTVQQKPKDPFVKIMPFYQQQAVALRKDTTFAVETKNIWQQEALSTEKIKRRALIHAPLSKKGPKCEACHTKEESLLNLTVLGATAYQAEKIQNNIVTQFFSRYTDKEQRIRIMSLLK